MLDVNYDPPAEELSFGAESTRRFWGKGKGHRTVRLTRDTHSLAKVFGRGPEASLILVV